MATFGPGTSGFASTPRRVSPARKGSLCLGQPRGSAPSLGSGQDSPPSVITTVRPDNFLQSKFTGIFLQKFAKVKSIVTHITLLKGLKFKTRIVSEASRCFHTEDDCSDPGIPPGAQRSAGRFHLGQKFTFSCQTGLDLLGSAERVCLENRQWSGSMPRCLGRNTYDSPGDVAAAMSGSLAGLMDVLSPEEKKKSV